MPTDEEVVAALDSLAARADLDPEDKKRRRQKLLADRAAARLTHVDVTRGRWRVTTGFATVLQSDTGGWFLDVRDVHVFLDGKDLNVDPVRQWVNPPSKVDGVVVSPVAVLLRDVISHTVGRDVPLSQVT